jgi:hypothetical protein
LDALTSTVVLGFDGSKSSKVWPYSAVQTSQIRVSGGFINVQISQAHSTVSLFLLAGVLGVTTGAMEMGVLLGGLDSSSVSGGYIRKIYIKNYEKT